MQNLLIWLTYMGLILTLYAVLWVIYDLFFNKTISRKSRYDRHNSYSSIFLPSDSGSSLSEAAVDVAAGAIELAGAIISGGSSDGGGASGSFD